MIEITSADKEKSRLFILKTVRKLQAQNTTHVFNWSLPPQKIFFDSGVLAVEGLKNGEWDRSRNVQEISYSNKSKID
jgi:hypothetical protein